MTWSDIPNTRHAWAFIYYCKRQGDRVQYTTTCNCYRQGRKFCLHPMTITIHKEN